MVERDFIGEITFALATWLRNLSIGTGEEAYQLAAVHEDWGPGKLKVPCATVTWTGDQERDATWTDTSETEWDEHGEGTVARVASLRASFQLDLYGAHRFQRQQIVRAIERQFLGSDHQYLTLEVAGLPPMMLSFMGQRIWSDGGQGMARATVTLDVRRSIAEDVPAERMEPVFELETTTGD